MYATGGTVVFDVFLSNVEKKKCLYDFHLQISVILGRITHISY